MSATRRAGATTRPVVEADGLALDPDGQIQVGPHHSEAVPGHLDPDAVERAAWSTPRWSRPGWR